MRKKKRKNKEKNAEKPSVRGYIIGIIACIPFLLFGTAMIFVSVNEFSFTSSCTAETKGTVGDVSVKSEKKRDSKNRRYTLYTYTAHYTFELDGKQISDTLVTSKRVKEGQTIRIRYDPDDPEIRYVKGHDDAGIWLPMVVGIVWNVFFLVIIYG
ncbi:MAG: DUF3592 domain-containing protein, partial [Oscillospiraceae bacterium]|nr:DUF3592 domain-containing protein [Oscillospiraceae bacterium]